MVSRRRLNAIEALMCLTMFLNEWDLIGSSAAREILLRMMKMRMKFVK